jgi:hypothetical protein
LFQQGWKCGRPELRAGLIAIAAVLAINHVALDALVDRPFTGVLIACVAVAACYGREHPNTKRRLATRPQPLYSPVSRMASVPNATHRGVPTQTPRQGDGSTNCSPG